MPLGDSITRGVGSSTGAGYRADLRNQLTPHAGAVQFVGSVTTDGAQHEGHSGWQIEDLAENIDGWLSVSRPNVVLLNIGTNDMDLGTDVAGAPARLGALVDRITDAAPDVTVLVSSIVPNANADRNKRVVAYNAAIPQLVAERRGKGLHVGFVDMNAVTTGDLADRLHPNDAGFAKMAGAFTKGVAQAAADGWIREVVNARTAPLRDQPIADYNVDLDGDHHADYLVVQSNGAVDAWRNNNIGDSAGGWSGYGRIAGGVGAPGRNIRFADINGDGKADYLAVSDNGAVDAWINKSSGSTHDNWSSWGRIAGGVGAPGRNIRFADINGDGKADFVTVDDKGAVNAWINQLSDKAHDKWDGWGTLASGVGAAGKNVRFADINGDGRADYVALDDNGAARAWLKKDGRDSWSNYGLIASGVGEPADAVRFSDVDGDGKADYVTVQDQGSLRAWGNQGGDPGNGWRSYGRIAGGVAASFRIRI
ncbi:FG-GAP-like repeat-containing protein [Streptomyces klenkii]|uniref:FG-GAP-like repeat-containing protein n=1 Tax=Streptomyces klenkii TaxID=1420899 RepID=UPI0033A79563